MFTHSTFTAHDVIVQHQLLTRVTQLVDDSTLRATLDEHSGTITAANPQKAHIQTETGRSVDKIVLEGF